MIGYETGLYIGFTSESIRKELLKDKKLTLETACVIATAMEVAAIDCFLMAQTQKDPVQVNRLQRRRKSQLLGLLSYLKALSKNVIR